MDRPVTVLVVDDQADMRLLVSRLLDRDGRFQVVAEADTAHRGVEVAAECQPDVVLLDLHLGDGPDGAAAVRPLLTASPRSMVAIMSSLPQAEYGAEPLSLGAFAYYEKRDLATLPDALARDHSAFVQALNGEDVIAPSATARAAG